jgi:hypothetical protein
MSHRATPQRWLVWNDPFNAEFLAIESTQMTSVLRQSLEQEKVVIREVQAGDRHSAVRGAFPEAFQNEAPVPMARRNLRIH